MDSENRKNFGHVVFSKVYHNMKEQAHLLGLRDNSQIEKVLKTVGLANANNKPQAHRNTGCAEQQCLKVDDALRQ